MPSRSSRTRRPRVSVLRIGHRAGRDPRLSTHVALTARAFGAERLYLHPPDAALAQRVAAVSRTWGGDFEVIGTDDWRSVVRSFDGPVAHLTMYGEPLASRMPELRRAKSLLVLVGGAKVPPELYGRATWNLAVGHQPHSEVAALAVLLSLLNGVPKPGAWPKARQVLEPMTRGKRVHAVAAPGAS